MKYIFARFEIYMSHKKKEKNRLKDKKINNFVVKEKIKYVDNILYNRSEF